MCPGNNESAGKHRSGKTRYGSKWLRMALVADQKLRDAPRGPTSSPTTPASGAPNAAADQKLRAALERWRPAQPTAYGP